MLKFNSSAHNVLLIGFCIFHTDLNALSCSFSSDLVALMHKFPRGGINKVFFFYRIKLLVIQLFKFSFSQQQNPYAFGIWFLEMPFV